MPAAGFEGISLKGINDSATGMYSGKLNQSDVMLSVDVDGELYGQAANGCVLAGQINAPDVNGVRAITASLSCRAGDLSGSAVLLPIGDEVRLLGVLLDSAGNYVASFAGARPAAPTDCAVSEWTPWQPEPWSACTAGQQTRTELRTRTITRWNSSGGRGCPVLEETRTVSLQCGDGLPLPKIDCVVSPWSAWQAGEWSECSNGSQSRVETRTRAIEVQPENGGAACPSLTDSRTVSQVCSVIFVHLEAMPAEVSPGGSATLTWASDGTRCTASSEDGVFNGDVALAGGVQTSALNVSRTYTLTCRRGFEAPVTRTVRVEVIDNSPGCEATDTCDPPPLEISFAGAWGVEGAYCEFSEAGAFLCAVFREGAHDVYEGQFISATAASGIACRSTGGVLPDWTASVDSSAFPVRLPVIEFSAGLLLTDLRPAAMWADAPRCAPTMGIYTPLRRCQDCTHDLGDVLLALRCPLFGKCRNGVEIKCAVFVPKPAKEVRNKDVAKG